MSMSGNAKRRIPPYVKNPDEWVDLRQAAVSFKKSVNTVRRWCTDGTFADIGVETCHDPGGYWKVRLNSKSP
jgi:hypothetical protein